METPVLVSSTVAQGNDHRLKSNISSVDEEQLYICSLVTSGPCFTTSKALRRSKNIAPVYKPWSIASSRSSFFFVRFIGTDPNAPQVPPESPLSLHPTIFKLLSQDLDISQQFLFLFSHPSILWNYHIYNLTALFVLVNDQQIRTPGPEFMVCSGTEVAQKVIIVIFKRTLSGTWPYHLSFGSNPHFPARS